MKEALGDKIDAWAPRDDSMHLVSGSQQEREGRKEESGKVEGEEWKTVVRKTRRKEKREKEREAEEVGSEQVEKDVTDGTVQIYVKVSGGKLVPTEVNLMDDKVEDVVMQFLSSEDVYVTMQGRVLKRNEKLKSCGVTDGCTIQVTNRLRNGGRHKDKKRKESAKIERTEHRVDQKDNGVESAAMDSVQPIEERSEQRWADGVRREKVPVMWECHKDTVIQMIEQNEVYHKIVESLSAGNDFEVEWTMQEYTGCFVY